MKKGLVNIVAFTMLLICSCSKPFISNTFDDSSLASDSLYRINNWYILAPFFPDSTLATLERNHQDMLSSYGTTENAIHSLEDFFRAGVDIQNQDSTIKFSTLQMDRQILAFSKYFDASPPVTAYMACRIDCREKLKMIAAMNANQSCKLWLNGELVYEVDFKQSTSKHREELFPVSLVKGANFVLAKITLSDSDYEPKRWRFEMNLLKEKFARQSFIDSYREFFIKRSWGYGDTLKVYTGPFKDEPVDIEIVGITDNEVKKSIGNIMAETTTGYAQIDLTGFPEGLYDCRMILESDTLIQPFFNGDANNFVRNLKNKIENIITMDKWQRLNTEALFYRLKMNRRSGKEELDDLAEYWNRIRIPSLKRLAKLINKIDHRTDPVEEFFFHSYHSNVTGSVNYYSTHCPPEKMRNKRAPLLINLLSDTDISDNWIDHWRNYAHAGISEMSGVSDKLGCIIMWTNCGGGKDKNRYAAVFNEILEHASQALPVDTSQIFVIGNCASTNMVLDFLELFPEKLAGAGFINPDQYIPHSINKNHYKLSMICSYHDEEIPFADSKQFYEQIRKIDRNASFNVCYKSTHYSCPNNYVEPLFKELIERGQ